MDGMPIALEGDLVTCPVCRTMLARSSASDRAFPKPGTARTSRWRMTCAFAAARAPPSCCRTRICAARSSRMRAGRCRIRSPRRWRAVRRPRSLPTASCWSTSMTAPRSRGASMRWCGPAASSNSAPRTCMAIPTCCRRRRRPNAWRSLRRGR
ncbi:hypothetical protein LP419_09165 [Massilia sp. H-1]|nr:hypothetical protein LP419_09165 [Massilia sp. H-1]